MRHDGPCCSRYKAVPTGLTVVVYLSFYHKVVPPGLDAEHVCHDRIKELNVRKPDTMMPNRMVLNGRAEVNTTTPLVGAKLPLKSYRDGLW